MAAEIPTAVLAGQVINNLLISYRGNAGLLRAVRQFSQGRDGSSFWKKATRLQMRTMEYVVDLLVASKGHIKQPDPRVAVGMGLAMVVGAMWDKSVGGLSLHWQSSFQRGPRFATSQRLRAFVIRCVLSPFEWI